MFASLNSLVLVFLALCFARGTSHSDFAPVSVPEYAQGSIHRWRMAIIFEREDIPSLNPAFPTLDSIPGFAEN
jgi:hypothetical protein